MKFIFGQIYIVVVMLSFISIWARHYWLIRSLGAYMVEFHKSNWQKMMENTSWLRPTWATLYYSKAVYDFIWKSADTLGDDNIDIFRKKIKRIMWELSLFFFIVTIVSALLIPRLNN